MVVSENTFVNRINFLVETQGIDRQAAQYGVTRRTIRRWQHAETSPSQRTRSSVSRRGRRAGDAIAVSTRVRGRFGPAQRSRATGNINLIRAQNQRLERERNAAIIDARITGSTARERSARAMPRRLTRREEIAASDERDILIRGGQLQNLRSQGISPDSDEGELILGDVPEGFDDWVEYEDYIDYHDDDWADWRRRNDY
tara:strand:- start:562 stop:1161 length:600 start_codon:yes stop_codon:yes gene_type:complete